METSTQEGPSETGLEEQVVTFHVGSELFAFPMESVREIVRMPPTVRVPLAPPELLGVANLRGQVLPIVSLRTKFAMASRPHDAATRVVVVDDGELVGYVVDSVASVLTVQPGQREAVDVIHGALQRSMISTLLKGLPDQGVAIVLDVAGLAPSAAARRAATTRASSRTTVAERSTGAAELDERQLVTFGMADQEYAFEIDNVQEIVQLPSSLTRMPNAPAHVLGVMTLRERLIPLVSLRRMFGLPPGERLTQQRVVLATLDDGVSVVGVVADSVHEVLRVSSKEIGAVPPFLRARQSTDLLEAICQLDGGSRLVSVLSAARLFAHEGVARVLADAKEGDAVSTEEETPASGPVAVAEDEQVVVFQLEGVEYAVDIENVQEIIRLPGFVTRVPNAPHDLAGVANVRGEVLPIVDFRRRLHLAEAARDDRQRVVVLASKGGRVGFIVDSVSQVLRVPSRALEPVPSLASEHAELVRQIANLEGQKRMILVLHPDRLVDDADYASFAEASPSPTEIRAA